jgi:uncharacterized protein (DUF2164 family)
MHKDTKLVNKIKEWLKLGTENEEIEFVCTELLDFIKNEEKGYQQPQNNKTIRGSSFLYLMDKEGK